jgi:hypothetical protein
MRFSVFGSPDRISAISGSASWLSAIMPVSASPNSAAKLAKSS